MNIIFTETYGQSDIINDLKNKSLFHFEVVSTFNQLSELLKHYSQNSNSLLIIDDSPLNWELVTEKLHEIIPVRENLWTIFLTTSINKISDYKKYFNQVLSAPLNSETILQLFRHSSARFHNSSSTQIQEDTSPQKVKNEKKCTAILKISNEEIHLNQILTQFRKSNPAQKKLIFNQLKNFIVYPGKKVIEKFSGNQDYYHFNKLHFEIDTGNDCLISKRLGFCIIKDRGLIYYPCIYFTQDTMEAYAFIFPIESLDISAQKNIFQHEMDQVRLIKGILYSQLEKAFLHVSQFQTMEWVHIAKGKLPQDGHNSYVAFLKEQKKVPGKIIDQFGTIDYRERATLLTVLKGEPVAKLIPETKSEDGYRVTGEILPSKNIQKTPLQIGENLTLDPKTNEYFAAINGMVILTEDFLNVRDTLIIQGNVNLESANIHYDQNVVIEGNIESGMTVTCGGNLIVNGTIGNAKIHVNGDLLAKGIVGCRKDAIIVEGDSYINFLENSSLGCLKSITISKHCINSDIKSNNMIFSQDLSKIYGGTISAYHGAKIFSIGNPDHIETKVFLGDDFFLKERTEILKNRKTELIDKTKRIREELSKKIDLNKLLEPQFNLLTNGEAERYNQMLRYLTQASEQEERINEQMNKALERLEYNSQASIHIKDKIYPNVTLNITKYYKKVETADTSCCYFLDLETLDITFKKI